MGVARLESVTKHYWPGKDHFSLRLTRRILLSLHSCA